METKKILAILVLGLGLILGSAKVGGAEPMGTAFTYQGHLYDANHVANGEYDFQFRLFDDDSDGNQVGSNVNKSDVDVIDAYFTVALDFNDANAFNGDARWLEIAVRPGASSGSFTTLGPRQEITPAPYALYAASGNVKQLVQDFVVASGESVTAGDVVGFLNGQVQRGFVQGDTVSFGSEYVFNLDSTGYISAAALSSIKFVVVYNDEGTSYFTANIGDVSGNSINYGPEYTFNSANSSAVSVSALSSTKFVVAFKDGDNSNYGTAVIGDVSGSSITFGSKYVFNSAYTYDVLTAALSSTKFVVAIRDGEDNSNYGAAVIGDVSGDTISFGSKYVFNSATTTNLSAAGLSSGRFVVSYLDSGTLYGTTIIGDVSDSNIISYSSEYVFNPANTWDTSTAALSSTKFVVAFADVGNSNHGTAVIGDVSGDTISFGPEYVFNPAYTDYIRGAALSPSRFVVAYDDVINSHYGTAIIGDVSDSNIISYGSEHVFNSGYTGYIWAAALSSLKFVACYRDVDNSYRGIGCIGDTIVSDATGIAKESKTAGETVPVIIGGISDAHSGLTPGAVYYSDTSGGLTANPTDCRVGLAISSSELLLNSDRDNAEQFFGDMVFKNNFRITEGVSYEGLILKNQLNREILTISEEGDLNVNGLSFRDQESQKALWKMFEDKEGLYLQNLRTGKVYRFVLQEVEKK